MNKNRSLFHWIELVAASLLVLGLAGCGGGGSGGGTTSGAAAPEAASVTAAALAASSTLNMNITSVTMNSPPVVNFTVTNETGTGMAGLTAADLRFNIAKLVPGPNGGPSTWQNYINRGVNGAVQGSQERSATGFPFGSLVDHGDGTYTYTFSTDIKDPTKNVCPAPCTDANGKPLDISYAPALTHRVAIQQSNNTYPKSTGVYDFVPSGAAIATQRDIVATAKCNECHQQVTAHGTRVDTKLCVTCHNPGSWIATSGQPNLTVDFKNMIHKIHNASDLPSATSTVAPTDYVIGRTNFSDIGPHSGTSRGPVFPQDVRNCTKCHDATPGATNVTAQGNNWKLMPSIEACGSCHDDVYFGTQADAARPYQTLAHPGGVQPDNSTCALCHAAGRYTDAKDIVVAHSFPARLNAAAARFQYNIISVTPTTAGSKPVVTFSVTDPTNSNAPYDIKTAAAFTSGANSTLTLKLGWNSILTRPAADPAADFGNDGSGQTFGQPVSVNLLGNAAVVPGSAAGTYTVNLASVAPAVNAIPAGQTGTLRVMMDGHPAGDVTTAGTFTDRLPVKSVFKDFTITGTITPRRTVVDVAKCNVCHDVLSLHGNNRTNEPGVCVICHNPNATDKARRPAGGGIDGKAEESIDFKRMIHGIHAGQSSTGGFRTKGLVVYGFGGSVNDFSKVVFPGKLSNCAVCHTDETYQLKGLWAAPTANGILGSTTGTGASTTDPTDNLRTSPIAAVCSSCHDSATATTHMQDPFNGGMFGVTQAAINAASPEACSFCHGPGRVLDVKAVHGVQ